MLCLAVNRRLREKVRISISTLLVEQTRTVLVSINHGSQRNRQSIAGDITDLFGKGRIYPGDVGFID